MSIIYCSSDSTRAGAESMCVDTAAVVAMIVVALACDSSSASATHIADTAPLDVCRVAAMRSDYDEAAPAVG